MAEEKKKEMRDETLERKKQKKSVGVCVCSLPV